jgi:hypothetical protein
VAESRNREVVADDQGRQRQGGLNSFGGTIVKNLAVAWLASSAAFTIAFVGWMVFWDWLDERVLLTCRGSA